MRTTIDLPDGKLEQAQRLGDFSSKRETVNVALDEFIGRKLREELIERLGTFKIDMTLEDLERLRAMD